MKFEWDPAKNTANQVKHGISFDRARALWKDTGRLQILAPYPLENRYILIGKIDACVWTGIYTIKNDVIRLISVRRARKKETALYGQANARHDQ